MRSVQSEQPDSPPPLVFFIDRSLGRHRVAEVFRNRGHQVAELRSRYAMADAHDSEVLAYCSVVHPRANVLGDRFKQRFAHAVGKASVDGECSEMVSEAVAVEVLLGWIPAHNGVAE